jgi:hypothetical protein
MALSFGAHVYAESARDEIIHAFVLLKHANHDYNGHRTKAIEHVQAAGRALNLKLEGGASERERKWESDQSLAEARNLLFHARSAFEAHDRELAVKHVDRAIEEIDSGLGKKK